MSIRRFLSTEEAQSDEAFERMAHLLLEAIRLHAVEGDEVDRNSFQCAIGDLQASLTNDPSPANALVTAGAVVKALEDYNRRSSVFIHAKCSELQSMVGMLTQTMSHVSAASETSISRLQELQQKIESVAMIEDMRTLRARLAECLESIRGESERQRGESAGLVAELQTGLNETQKPGQEQAAAALDPVTGLPLRAEAEVAMQTAASGGLHMYAALFFVERIDVINSRFGRECSDGVIAHFFRRLSEGLSADDKLFRWSEVSFVALLERKEAGEQVRREIARLLSRRLEQTFEMVGRSVVLPITSTWTIVPLFESGYAQNLSKLDAFNGSARRS